MRYINIWLEKHTPFNFIIFISHLEFSLKMSKRGNEPKLILAEDLHPSADFLEALDETESETKEENIIEACECKRLIKKYEDLFDPQISPELPTNDKMDVMKQQYQEARDRCTICPAIEEQNEEGCTCEKSEIHRADVLRREKYPKCFYFYAENIPSTELEWYYQRDRCSACKVRRKKKVLCYRKWTKEERTFRIADYLPGSYDRYHYFN